MGKTTQEHKCLNLIIEQFKTYNVDWLNFTISKESPLTYHHIIPKNKNGKTTLSNGAPLTTISHTYFHVMERKDYITARQITKLFKELNDTMLPPDEEYYEKINYYNEKYENKRIRIYIK